MKYSQKWLQEYIVEPLPKSNIIEEALNAKAFEVESIENHDGDYIYDIKVLPNRAHDALSHKYMALELCACLDLTFKTITTTEIDFSNSVNKVNVKVNDSDLCTRFMAVQIDNIKVQESPDWLKQKLESIGQKSINNIVDITNYVQFAINKPMHAYDARSIDGGLQARYATLGETLTTLDDKELSLDEKTLVIADDSKVLGLAGIKGGKYSGVKSDTTSIIIESANFNSVLIRKTSQKYNLKTDASKRFENGIADELVADGLYMTISEISKLFPESKIGEVTDVYDGITKDHNITLNLNEINSVLGSQLSHETVLKTLKRLGFDFEYKDESLYVIRLPSVRLDLHIKEDMIEEIGRIYGFENLMPTLPDLSNRKSKINKTLYVQNVIRNILNKRNFVEVLTYSLTDKGDIKLLKSASDKNKLRTNIKDGLKESLSKNLYNLPLLNQDDIRIYEMGSVFNLSATDKNAIIENINLCICIDDGKKKSNYDAFINEIVSEIKTQSSLSDLKLLSEESKPKVIELDITNIVDNIGDDFDNLFLDNLNTEIKYNSFSNMPFIVRDIALWCDADTSSLEVRSIIESASGDLCISINLFDEFVKEIDGKAKKSLGFRLVYQDVNRTLTDQEVNVYADNVYAKLKENEYEIR